MKETENLEFKESFAQLKEAIISIVAILNKHQKGKIIFGIKDNGEAVGVAIGKTTLRNISQSISEHIEPKIYPSIKEEIIQGKTCVVIDFSGENTPYFAYGRAYKRVSDENRLLSKAELEEMFLSKNRQSWDVLTSNIYTLDDISDAKLKKYVAQIGLKYTSKKNALEKLSLIKEGLLTNASIILFGKKPSKYFNLLNLRCVVFSGINKASPIIDTKDFEGDLFELIEYAQKYVLEHINIGLKIEGLKSIDVPEINKDALREAIINAFCHRDYSINQEVQIAVFKDRVEILNPGKLFGGLKIKDILSKPISMRRNELIADIFHRIRYIEKWGTGINKIITLEPETTFEEIGDFFLVTFKRNLSLKTVEKSSLKSSLKSSQKILALISEKKDITIEELAKAINITTRAVKKNISHLKKLGKLRRVGSDRAGYWEIIE